MNRKVVRHYRDLGKTGVFMLLLTLISLGDAVVYIDLSGPGANPRQVAIDHGTAYLLT